MPLPHNRFIQRLAILADSSTLCDILDIDSEELLERFDDVVEDKIDILRDAFDIDFDTE
jgi:hypothetical protein|tara:strand:- start:24 stop:200 length:177 start_codon:yes stop_codon:yes gene_type:complete